MSQDPRDLLYSYIVSAEEALLRGIHENQNWDWRDEEIARLGRKVAKLKKKLKKAKRK